MRRVVPVMAWLTRLFCVFDGGRVRRGGNDVRSSAVLEILSYMILYVMPIP